MTDKEIMLEIIQAHNKMAAYLNERSGKDNGNFSIMGMATSLAREALPIVRMAKKLGIDAKAEMQGGRINIYGNLEE